MMSSESNSEKSVSYQKKDGRGHARSSFFWYDNDKDLKVCFLVMRVILADLFGGNMKSLDDIRIHFLSSNNIARLPNHKGAKEIGDGRSYICHGNKL